MEDATKEFIKNLDDLFKAHEYSHGPNRSIDSDGIQIQVYVNKHNLKVRYENHPDPYYEGESIDVPYVEKKEAESLIPLFKSTFSKYEVIGKVTLFSTSTTPSYLIKLAYPPGVTQFSTKRALKIK